MSELNLILLGPPGAGKGTQAAHLVDDFGLPYIATGDILRAAVKDGTALGKKAKEYMDAGDLVPDDVIVGVVAERLEQGDTRDGFVLDGFPRTIPQAEALDRSLEAMGRRLTAVLLIEVPDDVLVKRISGRRICSRRPRLPRGLRPARAGRRLRRGRQRGSTSAPTTSPRRSSAGSRSTTSRRRRWRTTSTSSGCCSRFDGTRSPDEVREHIRATLSTLRLEESA